MNESFILRRIDPHEGTHLSPGVLSSSLFPDESVLRGSRSLVPDQDPDSASVETEGDAVNHDLNTLDA